MLQLRFSALFSLAITLALAMFLSCSSGGGDDAGISSSSGGGGGNSSSGGGNTNGWPFDSSGEDLQPSDDLEALGIEDRIDIEYKNGGEPEINNTSSEVQISAIGEDVTVTLPGSSNTEYSFVLSGTANNGSLKFRGEIEKKLYLNGVSITNGKGPAINIQGKKKATVHLVKGTQNFLEDGPNYATPPNGEDAKGAFFSECKLEFEGSGSLEVKGKYNHAIVADNEIEINNGKIIVSESVNDGIHANETIKVKGGVLKITSKGDAIQNENDSIKVLGGKIAATTIEPKSHGIASEGPLSISGNPIIQISVLGNGSKGIRARSSVEFKGGKTSINVSGTKHPNPDDESTPTGIKLATELLVEGGELTIKSLGSEAKGINTDTGKISAGSVNIEADDDGMKVQTKLDITGGTVYIKSLKKKAIDGPHTKTGGNVTLIPEEF